MSEEDAQEKEHEPSQRKLDEARRRGEIAKSTDVTAAAAFAGFLVAGLAAGSLMGETLGTLGRVLLDQADRLAPLLFGGSGAPVGGILLTLAAGLGPLFLVPMGFAVASLLAQRALVFAPEKLQPKLSRVSPLSNARNKFGRSGLFEFAKSFLKLILIGTVLWIFLFARLPSIAASLYLGPAMVGRLLFELVAVFLLILILLTGGIGVVDFLWQRAEHIRKNRMSRKEMQDEMKQTEGDPHMKQQRRQRGMEIASNRMMADVPKASVVIVNPTHYAVALRWSRRSGGAPVCVAKGVDEIAAKIRELAQEAGVPLHHDPPTARALHATVAVGSEIRPEHFRAVAAAIRFAEAMRLRAKGGWR
ncbi:EscU/YscU/HrcU family type III secretion system export apparatus switch protein [Halodurantibacterium flavum]|uniref:Flagellar biosynthesis protein FlhB n=1 Tax=Halodurantibacterium flavum TaxID=1382802 RepID=A0ABW4S7R8_9RHOB